VSSDERWEPPTGPPGAAERQQGAAAPRGPREDSFPEAIELSAGRISIGFLLAVASTGRAPQIWLDVGAPAIVVLLFVAGLLSDRWGSPRARSMWVVDALTFGLLTPPLVISTFAGVGDGPLHHAERTTYLQAILVAIVVLAALVVVTLRWFQGPLYSAAFLPAALTASGIALAYRDFRLVTVASGLAFVWLVSALATLMTRLTQGRLEQALPYGVYVLFMLLILVVRPALVTLGNRPAPVGAVQLLLLILSAAALITPELLNRPPQTAARSGPRRRTPAPGA
jgi:hypothetical protein